MINPRANHIVVNALEALSGWTPAARFASAIAHTLDAHLPYARYHAAGRARRSDGAGEGVVERLIGDWFATDLNPGTQIIASLTQPANAVWAFNAYNNAANLAVRTNVTLLKSDDSDAPRFAIDRNLRTVSDDPVLCRAGTLAAMEIMVAKVRSNATLGVQSELLTVSSLARYLGVTHSAAAEVAMVFECEGQIAITRVAKILGCHQRTLERRLREEGITAESLRRATRLLRAASRLRSSASLTAIAIDEGFSDLAHMSRAFKASCGMSPSLLRQAALGGIVPETCIVSATL